MPSLRQRQAAPAGELRRAQPPPRTQAKWKGYYREAGLDVRFLSAHEDGYTTLPAERIFRKEVHFGIAPSETVISYNVRAGAGGASVMKVGAGRVRAGAGRVQGGLAGAGRVLGGCLWLLGEACVTGNGLRWHSLHIPHCG